MSGEVIPFRNIEQDNEPKSTPVEEILVLTLEEASKLYMGGYEDGYKVAREELKDVLAMLRAKN